MKRLLGSILIVLALLLAFSVHASAESAPLYVIKEDGGMYGFYKNGTLGAQSESLDSLLDGIRDLGVTVMLDSVTADETLTLSGDYRLTGRLSVNAIEINGGSLTLDEAYISLGQGITLEYDRDSALILNGGELIGASTLPTVNVKGGSATLVAGRVVNSGGIAIGCSAHLEIGDCEISGIGFDVVTDRPISLETQYGSLSSPISIKYLSTFEKGTSTQVVSRAKACQAEHITLFDERGREYPLTFFDGSLAVHIPFTVRFLHRGVFIKADEYLSGEEISLPDISVSEGYMLEGWYTDSAGTSRLDPATRVTSDMTVYAVTCLCPPTYSISGVSAVYGNAATLKFDSVTHPLDGVYGYEWTDENGRVISTAPTVDFTQVADSGRYKCKLTFTYGADSVSLTTPPITVLIEPRIIGIPTLAPLTYNGREQYPSLDGIGYEYTDVGFTDSGIYGIELELCDPANTAFEGTDEARVTVYLEIKRADNYFTHELSISDIYCGAEINYEIASLFGKAYVEYANSPDGSYTRQIPTASGDYYARAVVEGTKNYTSLVGQAVRFSILPDVPTRFTVRTYPTKSVYRAFDVFDPDGLTFDVCFASGRTEIVTPDSVAFSYMTDDSFRVAHSGIIVNYCGHSCILPISVLPREHELELTFSDMSLIYNGRYRSIELLSALPEGLSCEIEGGGSDVGEYSVSVTFYCDSTEYRTPDPITLTLTILPLSVAVEWENDSFVYDGSAKAPVAFFTDVNGVRHRLSVNGAASLAGTGYIATAVANDPNYSLINATHSFDVLRADYDLSGVYWSADSFTYSGKSNTVTLHGLPSGVSVLGYVGNSAINAGTYTATAVLSYDTENYNPIDPIEHSYTVLAASYDLAGFAFLGGEYVYDGVAHYPTLSGSLPVGADGIPLEYSFSRGVINVLDPAEITVSFRTESKNYIAPESLTVTVRVIPLGVYASWSNTELIYNGSAQLPTAACAECALSVTGSATDAGIYTATAVPLSSNFTVLNPTTEYCIRPAANMWTSELTVGDVFLGREPDPQAAAMFGSVSFRVYTDPELTKKATLPLKAGKYYVTATADAGKNFAPLSSAPVAFEVIPILPASLSVTGKTDYRAFEAPSAFDLSVTLINNDGSARLIDHSELKLSYQNGDSFRYGDSAFTIGYGDIEATLSVAVSRADYDLTSVTWSGLDATYSGEGIFPTVSGLPDGVTVREYVGVGVINAGSYTVGVILDYDTENYNPPSLPSAILTVHKRAVEPQPIETVYNTLSQSPVSTDPLYTLEAVSFTDVGRYPVGVILTDPDNYELTTPYVDFTINPWTLSVTVNDADGYWFDPPTEFSLTFAEGFTASADELGLEYYIDGDNILVCCTNPNFNLNVTAGRVIKHNRPSPPVTRTVFTCLLLSFIIIAATVILVIRREDTYAAVNRLLRSRTAVATAAPSHVTDLVSVDADTADGLISDSVARSLLSYADPVKTEGKRRYSIGIDELSRCFIPGERIDISVLKARGIIPEDAGYVRVIGTGVINKPLRVYASSFSLTAVKMLVLTGGEAYKVKNK